ncbi:LuxR C-terminal-related transcriptional regulator [Actinotalea sp. M2MS4P-6]|uniref:ATP-binding protein n=1 Tax=Actinotalea sp. M2MS4P-6 TaxID=2983762 RepID=UPI0021E37B04|nr:LuxR C-terminal-related transcriptional regulator [Actinotalea sp. M2MS4P-6]MCV2395184.1 LuxR C-terminal-related transcriptional regulator [Actinotalea sp. M2MS4P-6]
MRGVHLTRREQETLHAVSRRLTNTEIADELGVSVRTVESHIASLRRKLLVESRRELIDAAQGYLGRPVPAAVDSFVGRAGVLATTGDLLAEARWVTVTGPAGIGKTRVALELARHRPSVVVPLEHAEPDGVLPALAAALAVDRAVPARLLSTCAVALSAADLLLVLDDADRVATEATGVVRQLLARVDRLRVLVTSRAALRGPGEVIVELDGLSAERPEDPAVRLFVERARAASRTVDLADRDRAAAVCRRLDGNPLAIELAAARTRHLSLAELDARLADGLASLGTAVDGGERHAALGAAFAWTWDLLTPDLRHVLVHLAALPRTFDHDLAAAALGRPVDHEVSELLDRSLLVRASGPDGAASPDAPARYRVPAALREFVAGHAPDGLAGTVAARHAHHHAAEAAAIARTARTDDGPASRARVRTLCPEIAAALTWAVRSGDPTASEMAEAVGVGIEQYGPEPAMTRALAEAASDERLRATWSPRVLAVVGRALVFTDLSLVGQLADQTRSLVPPEAANLPDADADADADPDPDADRLAATELTARYLTYRHRPAEALPLLEEAARLAAALGDDWERAAVLQLTGAALLRADPTAVERAVEVFDEARRAYAAAGDAMHVANVRYMMAGAAAGSADEDLRRRGAAWAAQALAYGQERGNEVEIGHALLVRAQSVLIGREDDLLEAERRFRRAGDLRCLSRSLVALAPLRPDQAEGLLREATSVGEASGDDQCHRSAVAALATLLWEDGRRDEAAAVLGGAGRSLGRATYAGLVPAGLELEVAPEGA